MVRRTTTETRTDLMNTFACEVPTCSPHDVPAIVHEAAENRMNDDHGAAIWWSHFGQSWSDAVRKNGLDGVLTSDAWTEMGEELAEELGHYDADVWTAAAVWKATEALVGFAHENAVIADAGLEAATSAEDHKGKFDYKRNGVPGNVKQLTSRKTVEAHIKGTDAQEVCYVAPIPGGEVMYDFLKPGDKWTDFRDTVYAECGLDHLPIGEADEIYKAWVRGGATGPL